MSLEIKEVVQAFDDELENWNFFSDSQRAYIRNGHIVVCLRNYDWYITKEPIKNAMEAVKALFEIMWIAEYNEEDNFDWTMGSKYWNTE